jgi:tRNA pseudouridine38-40 synthase
MRTVKLIIAYDGTDYKGWQIQNNDPTIQGEIEEKLGIILNQPTRITGSGRTDAGVHALNQVAHFRTGSRLDLRSLHKGLNSLLPSAIVVKEVTKAAADFHARFNAKSRIYKYLLWNGKILSPFYRRFSWHVHHQLDRDGMREAARCLMGWHDFASFQGTGSVCHTSEREVMGFTLTGRPGGWIIITIEASAFLRHMVRNVVGTLLEVGKGFMSVNEFQAILDAKDRGEAGITAPPQGLFLKEVKY